MTRIDLRAGAWRKIREAQEELRTLRFAAIDSAEERASVGDRGAERWWLGRADGLCAADTLLMSLVEAARAKRRRKEDARG